MYSKGITRTKNGWKCILYTSDDGIRYTTIDGDSLEDVLYSIKETIRDYVITYQEKGYDYTFTEESKEFKL